MLKNSSNSGQPPRDRELNSPLEQLAYEECLPAMRELTDDEIMRVNLDVPTCIATGLASVRKLRPLHAEIAEIEQVDMTRIEELEHYTLALLYAHASHITQVDDLDELQHAVAQARQMRGLLRGELDNLARHGVLKPTGLTRRSNERSHCQLALELLGLSSILRKAWPALAGKSPVELSQLDQAEALARRILRAPGSDRRKQRRETTEMRARAFTLFVRAYDEARRAVTFLRWHSNDAATIVPSLYAARRRRRRASPGVPK